MKRELNDKSYTIMSPYSLRRNNTVRKTTKIKLNDGLIFNNKRSNNSNKIKNFFIKIRKNSILILTICLTLYIYYLYLFFYICEIFYSSNVGLDLRFWFYLEDHVYRKAIFHLFFFHVLLTMFILSMMKVIFSDPGFIDDNYIDLFSLIPRELCNIPNDDIKSKEIQKLHDAIVADESNNTLITTISFDEFERLVSVSQDIKTENLDNLITKDFFYKLLYFTRTIRKEACLKNRMHCIFCLYIRPERSHHCKKCRKCILRMDHHCDILNNCIGYLNYNLYILFLFYSTCLTLYIMVTWIDGIGHYLGNYGWIEIKSKIFILSIIFIILIFISVVDLFIIHLSYISRGVTTIENSGNLVENLSSEDNKKSCWENMKEIMGENPLTWMIPKEKERKVYDGYIYFDNNREYLKNKITEIYNIVKNELHKLHDNSENQSSQFFNESSIREPI